MALISNLAKISLATTKLIYLSYKHLRNRSRKSSMTCQICGVSSAPSSLDRYPSLVKRKCDHGKSNQKLWQDETDLNTINLGSKPEEITNPVAILNNIKNSKHTETKNTMSNLDMPFAQCCFCNSSVATPYLTPHIEIHIKNQSVDDFNPDMHPRLRVSTNDLSTDTQSSNLMRSEKVEEVCQPINTNELKQFLNRVPFPTVRDYDDFVFRKVKDVSFVGGVSKDNRYSDFSMIVWFVEASTTYNAQYVGTTTSSVSKISERLCLHIVYDSLEQYYTLSGKVYKRSSYSDIDTEEGAIPDRICSQDEIIDEIKGALLFFKTNPRIVFKLFRKSMKPDIVSSETDEKDGKPSYSSHNHLSLIDTLKKSSTYSHGYQYGGYD